MIDPQQSNESLIWAFSQYFMEHVTGMQRRSLMSRDRSRSCCLHLSFLCCFRSWHLFTAMKRVQYRISENITNTWDLFLSLVLIEDTRFDDPVSENWTFPFTFWPRFAQFLLPRKRFEDTDKSFVKVIWSNKSRGSICSESVFYISRRVQELALPNLQLFYWAARVNFMSFWTMNNACSVWFSLEVAGCLKAPLHSSPMFPL